MNTQRSTNRFWLCLVGIPLLALAVMSVGCVPQSNPGANGYRYEPDNYDTRETPDYDLGDSDVQLEGDTPPR